MEGYSYNQDQIYSVKLPLIKTEFNPVVLCLSILSIAALVCSCVLLDNLVPEEYSDALEWVAEIWTWFHVSSRDVMIIFIAYIFFGRFKNVRLADNQDEKPEFSTMTMFAMALVAGVSSQMFYYAVSDPISHYDPKDGSNRYLADPHIADNTLAQMAIKLTFFHYGVHAWVVFCLFGLTLSLLAHREGLPLTLRSCFYPLVGKSVHTWLGDVVDTVAVVIVFLNFVFQVVFSARHMYSGLYLMDLLTDELPQNKDWIELSIIWTVVGCSALISLFGVKYGLSKFTFIALTAGASLVVVVFLLDNSWFLLNLFVQSLGNYLNWLLQLGFHTDAFEQLSASAGASERQRALGAGQTDGPEDWFENNTFVFWSWWLTWAPFVGILLARVSKGRTVREFITYSFIAPVAAVLVGISVLGGAAIASERLAHSSSYCCSENWDSAALSNPATLTALSPLAFTTANAAPLCQAATCNTCSLATLTKYINLGSTFAVFIPNLRESDLAGSAENIADGFDYIQNTRGPSPEDSRRDVALLSCYSADKRMIALLRTYFELDEALHGLSLFAMFAFAVVSLSFVGYVISTIIAAGKYEPSRGMSVIWLILIGGTSTALVTIEGDYTISDIANVSYVLSFPMSILSAVMMIALYRALRVTTGEVDHKSATWRVGFLDFCTVAKVDPIMGWFLNIFTGPYNSSKAYCVVRNLNNNLALVISAFLYLLLSGASALNALRYYIDGLWAFGWLCYLIFVVVLAVQRSRVRSHLDYYGSGLEDFFACLFSYPSVSHQMELELKNGLSSHTGGVLTNYREATIDTIDSSKTQRQAPRRSNRVEPAAEPPREPTPPAPVPRQVTPPTPVALLPPAQNEAPPREVDANLRRGQGNWANFA